jgi:hypothetical protein
VAILPASRLDPWRPASAVRPVLSAGAARSAPPPRGYEDAPIDVDVLWEELVAALRPAISPGPSPLAPRPAAAAGAYVAAMRRPPRPPRVDFVVV